MPRSDRAGAPRRRASQARGRRSGGVRWDRIGRVALLALLGGIMLLYVSPAKQWWEQSKTAAAQREELRELEAEHERLRTRVRALRDEDTIERKARRLGMVLMGERAYSVDLPSTR